MLVFNFLLYVLDALNQSREPGINSNKSNNYELVFRSFKKFAVFSGRARRSEYWFFALFNFVIAVVLGFLDGMLGTVSEMGVGMLGMIYGFAVLIPSLAVGVRRLHDIGKSGWWLLIGLIPFIGAIVLIVFFVMDSEAGENQYGPNPKGAVDLSGTTA